MAEPVAGAVYYVRDRDLTLPPNDHCQYHDERRPVLVISGPETNSDASWGFVLGVPISSSTSHKTRFCVRLPRGHRTNGQAYQRRRRELDQILTGLGIDPPFPWDALTLWEAEAKAEFPWDYANRRQHIKALADPVREQRKRRIANNAAGDLQATVDGARAVATDTVADSPHAGRCTPRPKFRH
jgi:mRNA-degrading endonuclease toxin of MazEF toxin-antitoxin module